MPFNEQPIEDKKTIYFQIESWGAHCIQHKGDVHHFNGSLDLMSFLQSIYGDQFQLFEVTEHNWQELHDQGAFDEQ